MAVECSCASGFDDERDPVAAAFGPVRFERQIQGSRRESESLAVTVQRRLVMRDVGLQPLHAGGGVVRHVGPYAPGAASCATIRPKRSASVAAEVSTSAMNSSASPAG
jgi:hypothetical protein